MIITKEKTTMYKQPYKCLYHIFTDNMDNWTPNLKEAKETAKDWIRKYGCVRIYKETNWNETDGIFMEEEGIFRFGRFPN